MYVFRRMRSTRKRSRVFPLLEMTHHNGQRADYTRHLVRTRGQGYLRKCDRNQDHKEDRDYKEEGHVASFVVSVARHGGREILQAGVLV